MGVGQAAQLGDPLGGRGRDDGRGRRERQCRQGDQREAGHAPPAAHAPASFAVGWGVGAAPVAVAGRVPQSELRAVRIAQYVCHSRKAR